MDAESEEEPKRGSAGRAGAERDEDRPDLAKLEARAKCRFGLSRAEFLSCSPRELDLLLQDEIDQARDRIYPAALICSVIANVNRDAERRPEPWQPADFMPGAKSEEDEMREFVEAIQRGETFETDPEDLDRFKRQMQASFKNVVTQGKPC